MIVSVGLIPAIQRLSNTRSRIFLFIVKGFNGLDFLLVSQPLLQLLTKHHLIVV